MPTTSLPPGQLIKKLAEARSYGHWLQGIQHFTDTLAKELEKQQTDLELLRCRLAPNFAEFLLPSLRRSSNQCPFIEAYRTHGRELMESKVIDRLVGTYDQVFADGNVHAFDDSLLAKLQVATGRSRVKSENRLLRGLELRLATILCRDSYDTLPDSFADRFRALITAYQEYWQTQVWSEAETEKTRTKTVAWCQLNSLKPELADKVASVVAGLNGSFLDPAVAFLVDTLCELSDVRIENRDFCTELEDGRQWHAGDTYGMVVGIRGILWKLRIEKVQYQSSPNVVADVAGSLYPHPHTAAYMQIGDDFQEAIRNAWLAVCVAKVRYHDYRWSLIPVDYSDGTPDWFLGPNEIFRNPNWTNLIPHPLRHQFLYGPLTGPSATLAFALALTSVQGNEGQVLRNDLVASAAFKCPHNRKTGQLDWKELANQIAILKPVEKIGEKAAIPELKRLNISNLVVADNQEIAQPLNPPFDKLIEVSNFDTAWKQFSTHEARIAEFSRAVSDQWKNEVNSIQQADFEGKQNDTDRLDRFVMPQLSWEIVHKHPAAGEERYKQEEVAGQDLHQFQSIWKRLESERVISANNGKKTPKHLFLYDTAGAGKSVVSLRLREQLCNPDLVKTFFEDGLPRLVFRWTKALPFAGVGKLIDQLCSDPDWSPSLERADREATVRDALEQHRVVIIVDGLDEFSLSDQSKMMKMLHPNASNRDLDAAKCQWIFTGRQHVIDEWINNGEVFSDLNTLRLRIQPFIDEKQDKYFADFTEIGIDWRDTLADREDKEQNELLGLPMNLREIRRLIEESIEHKQPIPKFVSASDLFLKTAEPLLKRALDKRTDEQKVEDQNTGLNPAPRLEILENVLGLVAFQMALEGQWRSIQPRGASLSATIEEVLLRAESRARGNAKKHWDWAINRLKTIALNNRATTEAFGNDYLAFQNRRVQEMHVARYLTTFSTDDDLRETSDLFCALGHNGDPAWENIWKSTIKMPASKVDVARYRSSIKVLFERPTQSKQQRRPTELMYIADRWIRRQPELGGFREMLREELGKQFRDVHDKIMTTGTAPASNLALPPQQQAQQAVADLLDSASYVFLADPMHKVRIADEKGNMVEDALDTGEFEMGEPGSTVPMKLSPFGICKWTLSNAQFQLFDDNFVGAQLWRTMIPKRLTHDERLRDF